MNNEFNKGLFLAGFGSFWWGFFGVLYFKYITFIGHIELVVHRCLWTTFTLIITTFIFSKWDIFFTIIKNKKNLLYLFLSGFLIFINWAVWIYAVSNNQIIEVRILPDNFVGVLGLKSIYSLPFFVILYPTLVLGLLLGFFFEYFRERKYRVKLKQAYKDIKFLQSEKKKLKFRNSDGDSEILNLIDRD